MKNKKLIRNIVIFLLLIIFTFYLVLRDQDIIDVFNIIKSAKFQYILIAVFCMMIYISCEAINIGRTLKALNEKSSFIQNLKYALIGFFFSAITPAASGGQPMQIYYMHRDNISAANSTLTLLLNLTCVQIVTISFAVISLLFNYAYLNSALILFFIIGVSLNFAALTLLLISILSKRLSQSLINFTIKVMKFFRVKNIEEKQEKLQKELNIYQTSAIYIKNNKILMLKNLLTTFVQFAFFYSIAYWTYRALGLSGYNIAEITTMQSVLYATTSGIPSPGAVGVSEGAFIEIYRDIYPGTMMSSAVLLSRGVSFYLFVIISEVVVLVNQIREKRIDLSEEIDELED